MFAPTLRALRSLAVMAGFALGLAYATPAGAWVDENGNRIDDRIEDVHANGWNAAFVDRDPTKRMRIGVANPAAIVYAIYVGYDHPPTAADQVALGATGVTMVWPFQYIDYLESRATWEQIERIAALPGVTRVEAVPVDYAGNHYGSRVVRARDSRGLARAENYVLFPSARQELGIDGTGIVIAILDTGVNDETDVLNPGYPGHESLQGKFLGGGEFWCGQPACATPASGSTNPQDHGSEASSYHGTHVAATALGTGGPGGFFAGVAPGARLVDCKVLSDAGATESGDLRGLEWCIANRNRLWEGLEPGSIWQGIDVVNMSLGSIECLVGFTSNGTDAGSQMVNAAVNAGIVVVVASGNDGTTECVSSPSAADLSICVGASQHNRTLDRSDDRVTTFSNEGPRDDDGDADHFDEMKPNVVAPGAGIISANGDFTSDGTLYQQLSGTSMATPHVAGCAALVLQANPALTPLQVRDILQNTAEHNMPTLKATGDRGQDPFGLDANYDPSCGWGLVDMVAAVKEAQNSVAGVQVTQIRAVARPADGAVDVSWVTQREHPFRSFTLFRAPDVNGSPGTFKKLPGSFAPAGDPLIAGDDNRTVYTHVDRESPKFQLGRTYWYRVDWRDLANVAHPEPPVPVHFGFEPPVATVFYSLVHNAVENDLSIRVGTDDDYEVGQIGSQDFEVFGPSEAEQDSSRLILSPPNAATSTIGNVEHFWSIGFVTADGLGGFLPPSAAHPWFLHVVDGGFINRTGRITAFSMFVNESPGSAAGTTFATDHEPMPQPTGEFGLTPATLWIPEPASPLLAASSGASGFAAVARLAAAPEPQGGVRLTLARAGRTGAATATVYRHTVPEFERREALSGPERFTGAQFSFVDAAAQPVVTYWYWVLVREEAGRGIWSGPVAAQAFGSEPLVTFARSPRPNPTTDRTVLEYEIGRDVAGSGRVQVSFAVHDLQGRVVRTLRQGLAGAGRYRAEWDARDERGLPVSGGVYYARLRAGGITRTVKVAIVP